MHVPCASAAGPASATGYALVGRRRTPGRIPVGRPDQSGCAPASSVRECGSALGIQRRISSRPVAIPGRSRCPPDRDLDDSDAAINGGMRDDYYRLRARRSRSRYGAADLSCLTGEPLATPRQEPFELAGVGACLPNPYRNHVFVRNDGLDPHVQVRKLAAGSRRDACPRVHHRPTAAGPTPDREAAASSYGRQV